MTIQERFAHWKKTEAEKLRPMNAKQRAGYILHYYRFWIAGVLLLLAVGFYIGDAVVQSQKEILLGFGKASLFQGKNYQMILHKDFCWE